MTSPGYAEEPLAVIQAHDLPELESMLRHGDPAPVVRGRARARVLREAETAILGP